VGVPRVVDAYGAQPGATERHVPHPGAPVAVVDRKRIRSAGRSIQRVPALVLGTVSSPVTAERCRRMSTRELAQSIGRHRAWRAPPAGAVARAGIAATGKGSHAAESGVTPFIESTGSPDFPLLTPNRSELSEERYPAGAPVRGAAGWQY